MDEEDQRFCSGIGFADDAVSVFSERGFCVNSRAETGNDYRGLVRNENGLFTSGRGYQNDLCGHRKNGS